MIEDRGESPRPALTRPPYKMVLRVALWSTAVAAGLCALVLLIWAVRMEESVKRCKRTRSNFLRYGICLRDYSEMRHHLPEPVQRQLSSGASPDRSRNPAGRPLYSWRVALMVYLEGVGFAWDRSQPWDSPANRYLVEFSGYSYDEGPGYGSVSEGVDLPFSDTSVLAITGPGTAFGDGEEKPKAMGDLPAGTILLVECAASGIPWAAPGDFDIRTMPQTINAPDGKGISSRHHGGFHVLFADGEVWFLSDTVRFEDLKKFFTVAGAKAHDRERFLGPYALARGADSAALGLP